MSDQAELGSAAPVYEVPSRHIVSVEHPAIIKNVDKAIETLQGDAGIAKILNPPKADAPAHLTLRPEDALARPVQSTSSSANNILLKVTVPKRTGRRRKKGSNDPFTEPHPVATGHSVPSRRAAHDLLRSLRDNVGNYRVEAVGRVDRTHVFRGMPDFVFSTTASSFTNRFREQILSYDYDKMKRFDLDMTRGATSDVDIIPPPSFSRGDYPFGYMYRQNPTVKQSIDTTGKITTVNTQQATKILTYMVDNDASSIPMKHSDDLPQIETLDKTLRETISVLQSLFVERPAWTRRALRNQLKTAEQRSALRHAIPYTGYIFRAGPWRDAIVRFGHDPRTTPESRKYQTLMFKILPRESEVARDGGGKRYTFPRSEKAFGTTAAADPSTTISSDDITSVNSHIFTGHPPLPRDGKLWMLCDITDPQLSHVLFPERNSNNITDFLRPTCELLSDGWYHSGTLAKVRTVMRAKIQVLIEDKTPHEEDYERVLTLPDHVDLNDTNLVAFSLDPDVASQRDTQLATEVRSTIKSLPSWKAAVERGRGDKEKRVQWTGVVAEAEAESEGEEEEIERRELLEAQVAAAVAAREQVEEDEDEDDDHENEDDEDILMD